MRFYDVSVEVETEADIDLDDGQVLDTVRDQFSPEDVFSDDTLKNWAEDNGYISTKDLNNGQISSVLKDSITPNQFTTHLFNDINPILIMGHSVQVISYINGEGVSETIIRLLPLNTNPPTGSIPTQTYSGSITNNPTTKEF